MTHRLAFVLIAFLGATGAMAQAADSTAEAPQENAENAPELIRSGLDVTLSEFQWTHRPLVIFADTERDPRFVEQLELINARPDELLSRDVVVLTDTDPSASSALRERLRPRGFMLVLIGKDGNPYLRKPFPWDVREISASIDKMPLRQQEIRHNQRP